MVCRFPLALKLINTLYKSDTHKSCKTTYPSALTRSDKVRGFLRRERADKKQKTMFRNSHASLMISSKNYILYSFDEIFVVLKVTLNSAHVLVSISVANVFIISYAVDRWGTVTSRISLRALCNKEGYCRWWPVAMLSR